MDEFVGCLIQPFFILVFGFVALQATGNVYIVGAAGLVGALLATHIMKHYSRGVEEAEYEKTQRAGAEARAHLEKLKRERGDEES